MKKIFFVVTILLTLLSATPLSFTVIKDITVNKHKFRLEIYNKLVDWEIFPHTYDAALYAFSNKDKLNKIVAKKYVLQK